MTTNTYLRQAIEALLAKSVEVNQSASATPADLLYSASALKELIGNELSFASLDSTNNDDTALTRLKNQVESLFNSAKQLNQGSNFRPEELMQIAKAYELVAGGMSSLDVLVLGEEYIEKIADVSTALTQLTEAVDAAVTQINSVYAEYLARMDAKSAEYLAALSARGLASVPIGAMIEGYGLESVSPQVFKKLNGAILNKSAYPTYAARVGALPPPVTGWDFDGTTDTKVGASNSPWAAHAESSQDTGYLIDSLSMSPSNSVAELSQINGSESAGNHSVFSKTKGSYQRGTLGLMISGSEIYFRDHAKTTKWTRASVAYLNRDSSQSGKSRFIKIVWTGQHYVTLDRTNFVVYTSTNGESWTPQPLLTEAGHQIQANTHYQWAYNLATDGAGRVWVYSYSGQGGSLILHYSSNHGTSFAVGSVSPVTGPNSVLLNQYGQYVLADACFGAGVMVVCGENKDSGLGGQVFWSTDGKNFQGSSGLPDNALWAGYEIVYWSNRFYMLGKGEYLHPAPPIFTSLDGKAWTQLGGLPSVPTLASTSHPQWSIVETTDRMLISRRINKDDLTTGTALLSWVGVIAANGALTEINGSSNTFTNNALFNVNGKYRDMSSITSLYKLSNNNYAVGILKRDSTDIKSLQSYLELSYNGNASPSFTAPVINSRNAFIDPRKESNKWAYKDSRPTESRLGDGYRARIYSNINLAEISNDGWITNRAIPLPAHNSKYLGALARLRSGSEEFFLYTMKDNTGSSTPSAYYKFNTSDWQPVTLAHLTNVTSTECQWVGAQPIMVGASLFILTKHMSNQYQITPNWTNKTIALDKKTIAGSRSVSPLIDNEIFQSDSESGALVADVSNSRVYRLSGLDTNTPAVWNTAINVQSSYPIQGSTFGLASNPTTHIVQGIDYLNDTFLLYGAFGFLATLKKGSIVWNVRKDVSNDHVTGVGFAHSLYYALTRIGPVKSEGQESNTLSYSLDAKEWRVSPVSNQVPSDSDNTAQSWGASLRSARPYGNHVLMTLSECGTEVLLNYGYNPQSQIPVPYDLSLSAGMAKYIRIA